MVWIRQVRTSSGATAVQIAEYVDGRRRIVRHVGSSHDEAGVAVLIARAEQLLVDDAQGELELGLERDVPVARVFAQKPERDTGEEQVLFPTPAGGASASGSSVVVSRRSRVPRVVGTFSRVLYDAIGEVYDSLGFDALSDEVFRDLVVARIVEPTSLLDVGRVLADLGRVAASLSTRNRTLKRCHDGRYRDRLAELCFAHAHATGNISLILYDVTTLWFEAEKEDDLRKVGYSKERRVDPQVVVGLVVDRTGFPLEISCWEGSKAETLTIVPAIEAFKARHGIENMVVVADAGMLSGTNLAALDEAGYRFIVGSRAVKAPLDLESHFRWHGDAFVDGQVIDTITPKSRFRSENDPALKAEPAWDPHVHTRSWRAIWAYSARRAARDNKTLTAQENRARDVVNGDKTARTPRFVKVKGDSRSLDGKALARARKVVGLKGYVTNMPASAMPATDVISSYHDLWNVETSFRMSKHNLRARPLFARKRDAIEAHLTIVFAALAVARTIQTRTGVSIRRFVRTLRPLRAATITINGTKHVLDVEINDEAQQLLDKLSGPQHPELRH